MTPLGGVTGPLDRVVADLSAPEAELDAAEQGLPDGAARAEAVAVRLRSEGAKLRWQAPTVVRDLASLLEFNRERGRSSVQVWRARPALLSGLQLGAWFDAPWRTRLVRRRSLVRAAIRRGALSSPRLLAAAADHAFWAGVREEATPAEWQRLTANSYVALVYHRFAGEMKPGQERIDIAPRRFARQLQALRLAGYRPLSADQILEFHGDEGALPGRRFAITVDDAIVDSVAPLGRHARHTPMLFVPTAELGGAAHWIDGEPVAGWEQVKELAAAGVAIGSHTRHHRRLTELDGDARREELVGSLAELRERLARPAEVLAYPNGDHDFAVCTAAGEAGYRAAFTTEKGRNGAGTDPHCLRRVSVHGRDGVLAVLWKATTGEALPDIWLRLRSLGRSQRR